MSIDATIGRFGPSEGAAGHRGPTRPVWDYAENSTLTQSQTMSFWDFLDILNPLQHLPFIGPIYRELSGDEMTGTARVLGGALYGGPVGLATGVADAVIHQETGQYVGSHVMTAMLGDGAAPPGPGVMPDGEIGPRLALGPSNGETGLGGADNPVLAAQPAAQGTGNTEIAAAPTTDSGATVIVRRDGTILYLGDPPPPVAEPMRGTHQYQVAAQLDR